MRRSFDMNPVPSEAFPNASPERHIAAVDMLEPVLREQQLQALNAALSAAATREGELRTEVVRLGSVPAGSTGATARSTGTIDTRSLGKPDHFDGDEKK